jgi:Mn2+/Fe2+ NRAMP family transporter
MSEDATDALDPETAQSAQRDRQMLRDAESQGTGTKVKTWLKLSGPGWLQSAITLGGGSLAGSLFLGMVAGYSLLWLQILAMGLGVVMLGAIGYVTLSTGQRPLRLINQRVNPVLGWGWAFATLAANIVWCLPQFSLANSAVQQNLGILTEEPGVVSANTGIICAVILAIAISFTMVYDRGGKGLKIYENTLRIFVGLIVLCFFGVVVTLAFSGGSDFSFKEVFAGLVPDFSMLTQPAEKFRLLIETVGEYKGYWHDKILGMQRDIMITATATAVGINMTFLFPYSLLKKGWDRSFRGLSIFDLATGMAIPFVVATGCVVIASAHQFHAQEAPGVVAFVDAEIEAGHINTDATNKPDGALLGRYVDNLVARVGQADATLEEKLDAANFDPKKITAELRQLTGQTDLADLKAGDAKRQIGLSYFKSIEPAERSLAAMLVKRDSKHLATALEPLTGPFVSNYIFGFGVLAMALSTITILMLISGFTFCEVFGFPHGGLYHKIGCLLPAIGVLGPFVWSGKVAFWLAVPTSVFGMTLLPIAYVTFFLLMNNKKVLGDDMPTGRSRLIWNTLMGLALSLATLGAGWSIWDKSGWYGVSGVAAFVGLAIFVHFKRQSASNTVPEAD